MQITNPYLPSYEYIPDGEPHVFGDRVYIFGSHDRFNGRRYCENDYVCWSAAVTDLTAWRFEGVIYRKDQDPYNADGSHTMFAPDVTRGPDGRYYLYYGLDFVNRIGVAVSSRPQGPYVFYGNVRYSDGTLYGCRERETFRFDPAVFTEGDKVYLYTGFCPNAPMFQEGIFAGKGIDALGCTVVTLSADMLTVLTEPRRMIPGVGNSRGTGFEGHEFYEASSMRKFGDRYYFIYSSFLSHELAYAVSDHPDRDFRYGGSLHSNGNIGYEGNQTALCYWGNNHGSVELINGSYYIFGHRQTNQHEVSRQGVAEKLRMRSDGGFAMAEMTSCGLNGGPLRCEGTYEAGIACVLMGPLGACKTTLTQAEKPLHPYFTQDGEDRETDPGQYVANILPGTVIGYKYFDIPGRECTLCLTLRSHLGTRARGRFLLSDRLDFSRIRGTVEVDTAPEQTCAEAALSFPSGKQALYLKYEGSGSVDLLTLGWK